jgi:hypothetical protein
MAPLLTYLQGFNCLVRELRFPFLKSYMLISTACRLADLGHQLCSSHINYWVFVSNFGNPRLIELPEPQSLIATLFLGSFIGSIVQVWLIFQCFNFLDRVSCRVSLPFACGE